ncbi:MAG TPA: hypothetical protein VGK39_07205, partial [Cyclobacteriaceae bacterium]
MAKKTSKPSKATEPKSNSSAMKTTEIRDLIDFISKSGLNEVNIETSELKLNVKREPDQKVFKSSPVMAPVAAAPAVAAAPSAPAAPSATKAVAEPASSGKKTVEIKSPMIGTFYRSGNPDTP